MSDPTDPRRPDVLPGAVPADEPAGADWAESPGTTYEAGGRRRRRSRTVPGCLAVLTALAIIAGGLWFLASRGMEFVESQFAEPEDYPGPGTGQVTFEVRPGDSSAQICRNLKAARVVASVDACIAAANANPGASGVQVGFYPLKKEMAASAAIDVLVEPANIMTSTVTVPEGLNVDQIVEVLAEGTDFEAAAFEKALANPDALGLPDYAEGNPEGYLFPSTYAFGPNEKPRSMLQAMVDRWEQAAEDADLEAAAEELGYTPHELMTVASLVEAEGRGEDMPKVARVIYNRVENPDNGETNGLLQVDAAVNYALGAEPIARLTQEQIDSVADSPYNTYTQPGLPPGPIEAPGDAAIRAATNPANGEWLYYVTVDLATGETKFAETYQEFLGYKAEFEQYCATQSDRC